MAVTIDSVTPIGANTFQLSFSSSTPGATFYIYVDGVLCSMQSSGVYTLSNWTGAEVVEILDTDADPSPAFPAVLTLGWLRDPDAASYKLEQWDGSAYVEYCTQAATLDTWQTFTTPALSDEAVAQWRITPYDAAGNAGTPTVCSALIVRYPDVPVVEYSYAQATGVVTVAEPAATAKTGLQLSIKTDNLSTGSSEDDQFRLPLFASGAYNFTVYWGDGTSSVITRFDQAAVTHTYLAAGTYTVQIEGTCRGWAFQNSGDRLKVLEVQRWGTQFRLGTDEGGYFYGCANLELTATDAPTIESGSLLTDCFRDCVALKADFSGWDVSGAVSLAGMFDGCDLNETGTTDNYDATLAGWAALDPRNSVAFDGGSSQYSVAGGKAARDHLTADHAWAITDGGAAA